MKIYSIQSCTSESIIKKESFIIEPLDFGHGITVGNTLRRILLSEIYGFAITAMQINNVTHEFSAPNFLKDDILDIIFNLNQVVLAPSSSLFFNEKNSYNYLYKSFTSFKGPLIVTAGMLNIPSYLKMINPGQYICTIVDNKRLNLTLNICYGKGISSINFEKEGTLLNKSDKQEGMLLGMSACFSPIKKVNFKVKSIHDTKGNIKESLHLQIETNGSVTPAEALLKSVTSCLNIFYPILTSLKKKKLEESAAGSKNFLEISELYKNNEN